MPECVWPVVVMLLSGMSAVMTFLWGVKAPFCNFDSCTLGGEEVHITHRLLEHTVGGARAGVMEVC